jgi:hypothetical protein
MISAVQRRRKKKVNSLCNGIRANFQLAVFNNLRKSEGNQKTYLQNLTLFYMTLPPKPAL